jgi:hypothetical protein
MSSVLLLQDPNSIKASETLTTRRETDGKAGSGNFRRCFQRNGSAPSCDCLSTGHFSTFRPFLLTLTSAIRQCPTSSSPSTTPVRASTVTPTPQSHRKPPLPPYKPLFRDLSPTKTFRIRSCGNLVAMAISTMKRNSSRQVTP